MMICFELPNSPAAKWKRDPHDLGTKLVSAGQVRTGELPLTGGTV